MLKEKNEEMEASKRTHKIMQSMQLRRVKTKVFEANHAMKNWVVEIKQFYETDMWRLKEFFSSQIKTLLELIEWRSLTRVMQDNEIKQIEQHLRSDLYKMKEQIDSLKKDKESLSFKVEQMRDKETKSEYERGVMKVEMESKVTNMEMTHEQL